MPEPVATTVQTTDAATVTETAPPPPDPLFGTLSAEDFAPKKEADTTETPAPEAEEPAETPADDTFAAGDGDDDAPADATDPPADDAERDAEVDAALVEGDDPPPAAADAPAAPDPKAAEAVQKAVEAFRAWERDYDAVAEAVTGADGFDLLEGSEVGNKAIPVLVRGLKYARDAIEDLSAKLDQSQAGAKEAAFWRDWGASNPEAADKGQAIWQEELAKAGARYTNPEVVKALAEEKFNARVNLIKGKARAAAAAAPPTPPAKAPPARAATPPKPAGQPPKPGGGRLLPNRTTPPAPKPKSPEEKFSRATSGLDLRNFP